MSLSDLLPSAADSIAPEFLFPRWLHLAGPDELNLDPDQVEAIAALCENYAARRRPVLLEMVDLSGQVSALLTLGHRLTDDEEQAARRLVERRQERFGRLELLYLELLQQGYDLLSDQQMTALAKIEQARQDETTATIAHALTAAPDLQPV